MFNENLSFDFNNKVVLVTGSSRGIGKAIAEGFVRSGATVFINGCNNADELIKTTEYFNSFAKNKAIAVRADVSNYYEVKQMVEDIINRCDKIDVLVNNAAVSYVGLFSDMKPCDWDRIIRINLYSVFNCANTVIPHMLTAKSGSIINISSVWGVNGASCEAAYSASKGAVNAFTKSIAKELGPSNIRANAIACGVIDTSMNDFLNEDEQNALKDQISLMRFGQPSDVAQLTLFLSSEYSGFLTGQVITLDGGMLT